jgi:hypothetical protein
VNCKTARGYLNLPAHSRIDKMVVRYTKHGSSHSYATIREEDIKTGMILMMDDMYLYKVMNQYTIVIDKTDGRMLGDDTNDIIICRCNEKGDTLNNESVIAPYKTKPVLV